MVGYVYYRYFSGNPVRVQSIGENTYMATTPRGTLYAWVDDDYTLRIQLPNGPILAIWAPIAAILPFILWIVWAIAWLWATAQLDYSLVSRLVGLFLNGWGTVLEGMNRAWKLKLP